MLHSDFRRKTFVGASGHRKLNGLCSLLGLFLLAGCVSAPQRQTEVIQNNLFKLLEERGYRANLGLAGIYEPGNLIQVQAPDAQGRPQSMKTPIVFMWRSDCFPGQPPRISPFVLPESAGHSEDLLSLDASLMGLFLPALTFDRSLLTDYRVRLGDAWVHTLAKGDLSHQFSPRCVAALARAMEDGDHIEWFAVIVEAVVVDALSIEMNWQAGTSASARLGFLDQLKQQLASVITGRKQSELGLVSNDAQRSVLQANGPIIIGYRMRPLQPVYE